ncbi:adenosine kinase [Nematocida parisii]|nr:adenosine kinase [Nematocida parisii]KAI5130736.1 adenosine kinase [Nematocida parisii]KAI5143578.1 adenosine kinase [Nematocida parisii]KAI5145206.1 adenosine kinase [Nematocida parisii]KAI5155514.1 adenosine kinase [Nematocida parisii]
MPLRVFYTLCIPLIDIYILHPEIINELKINHNSMTLYNQLPESNKHILEHYAQLPKSKNYYGGMSYNSCAEIAKQQKINAVFLGMFSTDNLSKSVFNQAIAGEIKNLLIVPEYINSESGKSFIIPNGKNRAMITKINEKQKITDNLISKFLQLMKKSTEKPKPDVSALYIAGYTAESSNEPLLHLIKERIRLNIQCMIIFNLADPGVVERSYAKIKPFIEAADWVIGNREEFTSLYKTMCNKSCVNPDELTDFINKNFSNAVITDGSEPVTVFYTKNSDKKWVTLKPPQIEVNNPTGAGDIFAATFFSNILIDSGDVLNALNESITRTNEYLTKMTVRTNK